MSFSSWRTDPAARDIAFGRQWLWFDLDFARVKAEPIEAMLRETIRLSDTTQLIVHVAPRTPGRKISGGYGL